MHLLKSYPWIIPTVIFSFLVLLGANMHPLWGDEAESALFGRNIVKYGVPRGWDGVNIMGINDGVVLNKELINHTSPWAQYYTIALSFLVFGESSFTARLPFVIISIVTLPLFYLTVLKIAGDKRVATISVLLLSIAPAFILFSYQARYYALTTFCSVALTYLLFRFKEKSIWPKIFFALTGIVFFYSNYVVFGAFFAALMLSYTLFLTMQKKRRDALRTLAWVIGLGIVIAVFTLPWYVIMQPSSGRGEFVPPTLAFGYLRDFFYIFYAAYSPFNLNDGLPLLLLLGYIGMLIVLTIQKKAKATYLFFLSVPFFYLFFMTSLTALTVVDTAFIHNRYTMNIFPFLLILVAVLGARLWQWKKWVGGIILLVYICSNLFSLLPPRSLLLEFAGEVIRPYPTPDKVVADYLMAHAKDGDTAFVSLDRDHEPLIFHLKDKIRFVNRISPANPRVFPKNRGVLPRYLYYYLEAPDWVILYSKRGNDGTFLTFDHRGHFPLGLIPGIVTEENYEEIALPVFFADMSRPEIEHRSFTEVIPSGPDRVFIYKKRK